MTNSPEPTPSAHPTTDQEATAVPIVRDYLTIEELAQRTGISERTIYRLKKKGLISAYQPGGPRTRVVYPPDAIERAIKASSSTPSIVPENSLPNPTDRPQRGPRPQWLGGTP